VEIALVLGQVLLARDELDVGRITGHLEIVVVDGIDVVALVALHFALLE
jgi:hypothetical protein